MKKMWLKACFIYNKNKIQKLSICARHFLPTVYRVDSKFTVFRNFEKICNIVVYYYRVWCKNSLLKNKFCAPR